MSIGYPLEYPYADEGTRCTIRSIGVHARCSALLPVSVVDVASIVPASRSAWSAAPLSALIFFSMDLQRRLG